MKTLTTMVAYLLFTSAMADVLFIKSTKAKIKTEKNIKSEDVTVLKRGAQVTVKKEEKPWLQIETQDKKIGWVMKLLTTKKLIKRKKSLLHNDVDISSKARRRASKFTSAAAARGLLESGNDPFAKLTGGNYEALKEMEALYIPPEEGHQFITAETL